MRDSRATQIIASLVTIAATTLICMSVPGGCAPRLDPQLHEAIGAVMARQALSLLQPDGQLIVIARDTSAFENPATDIQLASFKKTLGKKQGSNLSFRTLQVDPLRPVEVPPGDFYELIKSTPKGSVIVSFMGPPVLSAEQCFRLGEIKPSIIAFCSGSLPQSLDLRTFFAQGILKAAVISKSPPAPIVLSKEPEKRFDQLFVVISSTNLNALSLVYGASPSP